MNVTKNLNAAMRYIEKHLLDVIDYNVLAKTAGCSEYQFRRMFSHLADISLNEYVRKRRLSAAVELLRFGDEKIIDIALKCGYSSPDSFGKAFFVQYGITPFVCRKSSEVLKAFPPLFFQLSLIGGIKMDCNIIKRSEMLFEGCFIKCEGGNDWGLWEEMDSKEASDPKYAHHHLVNGHQAYEIRFYTKNGEYAFIGLEVTHEEADVAWEYLKIPAAEYAVFDINQKIDTRPQFEGVNDWLDEHKDILKQMEWDAGGRIDSSVFVICLYDHSGKYAEKQVMEFLIPIVKK